MTAFGYAYGQLNLNDYPAMKLIEPTGFVHSAKLLTGKNILILYFPDCDHCQREAAEIGKHIKAFTYYQVWFISIASHQDNARFAKDYQLAQHKNFHFVRTDAGDIYRNFGNLPTPSFFIYSAGRQLVKSFKGETTIEEILKAL